LIPKIPLVNRAWTKDDVVLRVWRHSQKMPGLAAEHPPRSLRQNMVSWYVLLLPHTPYFHIFMLIYIDALEAATSSLSVEARKRAEKDAHKKALKAEAAEAKQAATIASSKVIIKRVERNKRKFVTAVSGLEAFGLDNKKVAKDFGKKFATGSSVTKLPSGGEEIVVQGDVSDEIEEFLLDNYKVIPEDNIELVESKVKKGTSAT
jgi:density-regulated protein DRP1